LSGKASRALGWSFGSIVVNKFSLFGIGVLLARLLGPHAFGTYAVAYVAMTALLTFNELGVSLAIIRWEGDPGEIAPTVTTISMLVSTVIYAGCFFGAPAYASAMGVPSATSVVRVLAVLVLIDGFTNTPIALLQRSFRQGQRTIADQLNTWLGTGTTLALAWSGYGAMSLAIGRLVGCLAGAILLAVFAPESLRVGFDPAKARALLRFGLPLAGAELVALAVTTVDQVVVGHVLGAVALGFYVLALNLANWPITIFSQPVGNVAPAVFSRLQRDGAAMRTTFLSAAGLLCAVALPVCLVIGGSAEPLISFVYGTRWVPAAQPLIWLALLGAVQIFFLLSYDFFVVLKRSRFLLIVQLAWLLVLVPALVIGARANGIYGASLAEAAVAVLGVLPWYLRELSKVGIRLRALSRHLWLPVTGAAVAGLVAVGAAKAAPGDFAALAASGAAAAAVIALLVYRMRNVLALLRSAAAEPRATGAATSATAATARPVPGDGMVPTGAIAEEPSPAGGGHSAAGGKPPPSGGEPSPSGEVLGAPAGYGPGQDPCATSPLYRLTVASLCWDPGKMANPGAAGSSRGRAADGPGGQPPWPT
jgi:O-antigen/teichoic acid export membrane protein